MVGEIKSLKSQDIEAGRLPEDPSDCAVSLLIHIGPEGEEQSELFFLEVITPRWFERIGRPFWGTRVLIVPGFDWMTVEQELGQMLAQCQADTWPEVIEKISHFLER
jgi:hypothetical protein